MTGRLAAALSAGAILAAALGAAAAPSVGSIDKDGLAAELSRQRGRVVVLNFWATWCEPCREEFPLFVSLDREMRPRGLSVISVSLDAPSSLEGSVRPFLAAQNAAFACFIKSAGDDDPFINAIDPAWSGALPATFVYDAAGIRVHSFFGPVTRERLAEAVTPLLPR
jgi:thiol-disulfide isomerase/thioredoxin